MLPRLLAGLLLAALVVLGIGTVRRFQIWAPIDERPHYAYVQSVAEDGRLPRIDDLVSPQVQAITDRTWPRPSPTDPAGAGLAGRSYEAFQPPLYYLTAVPAFAVAGDHRDKVFALRAYDLALVLVACVLLLALARRELPEAPAAAFAGGLIVLLWPGTLVRAITVSNLPLELVLAPALLLALMRAHRDDRRRWLVVSGLLVGACLLTALTLVYLTVPFALVLWARRRARPRDLALAVAAPVLVLAPWLISNLVRFGSPTETGAARAQQLPYLYPHGYDVRLGGRLWDLTREVLPSEWDGFLDHTWIRAATLVLLAAVVLGAAALIARGAPTLLRLTGSATGGFVAMALAIVLVGRWNVLLRYAYPVLAPLGVAVVAGVWRRAGPRMALAGTTCAALLLAALWVDLAGRFYFTNVGRALGI